MAEPSIWHPLHEDHFELDKRVGLQESMRYEFKSVGAAHALRTIRDQADEYAVAFLNEGSGGRILWGVTNDGYVQGVELNAAQCDEVRRGLQDKLATVVPRAEPSAYEIELHPVWVRQPDGKRQVYNDKFVVELLVKPAHHARLYSTAGGTCWLKAEQGKHKLLGNEIEDFVRTRIPSCFLGSPAWLKYFRHVDAGTKQCRELAGYQDLHAREGQDLETAFHEFLGSNDRLLVLYGEAGSGKTAALCRFVGKLSHDWTQALEANIDSLSVDLWHNWLPVYFSLRGTHLESVKSFAAMLIAQLQEAGNFWEGSPPEELPLLRNQRFRWLVCLDGYDEIRTREAREHFIGVLRQVVQLVSGKVILSTRPIAKGIEMHGWSARAIHVEPLTEAQIHNYLIQNVDDRLKDDFDSIYNSFRADRDFWTMLSRPAYLEAVLEELAGIYIPIRGDAWPSVNESDQPPGNAAATGAEHASAPVPNVEEDTLLLREPTEKRDERKEEQSEEDAPLATNMARLVDKVYRRLHEREQARQLLPAQEAEDRWGRTGRLALQMDGHRERCGYQTARCAFTSEEALAWVLSLGILVEERGRTPYRFFTELTKLYFAADHVLYLWDDGERHKARQRLGKTTAEFQGKMEPILLQLAVGDISSLFEHGGQNG